ncbi:hypothetical protein AKO1_014528 [Acrasis kona]|uniref:Probable cytosolic iron-sulfur protein assembly protein CIAO1 homolog n=1 Tax=Acrasis kona TaxID=1008807 RepID=A0AAW2Z2J9_9EUKA
MLTLLELLSEHEDKVWCVQWSPNGELLASCGADKNIKIYKYDHKLKVARFIDTLQGHSKTVRSLSWSPCGSLIASASFDGTFVLGGTLHGHESEVKGCCWDKSGDLIATCGRDKMVWIYEINFDDIDASECLEVLPGHSQDVKFVAWHPNSGELYTCSYDDTIRYWHVEYDEWVCAGTLKGHSSTVWSLAFDNAGEYMASCSDDTSIIIWKRIQSDSTPNKCLEWIQIHRIADHHKRCVYSISWSQHMGRDLIATACGDNMLRIFNMDKQKLTTSLVQRIEAHKSDINCVCWNPIYTNIIATASDDRTVKLYELEI